MFYAGLPGWRSTGHPVYTEPEFVKFLLDNAAHDSFIIVDLRDPTKAQKSIFLKP